jgi:hypothetical protein
MNPRVDFSLEKCIGDPIQLFNWKLKELPNDEFSRENALIMEHGFKYNLVIDPEM